MKGSSDAYSTKLKTMKTSLSKAEEAQVDMTVSMEECEQRLSDLNEKVDALQSSYKSLKDVTEQYNKNGFITMDQLQSLMQMDTKYLACLEMKNGALSVNKESYIEMTKAQLDLMEAEAVDEAISELVTDDKYDKYVRLVITRLGYMPDKRTMLIDNVFKCGSKE